MSLYNIETEDQCWAKVDDLLELTRHAKATPSVKTIGALKNRLKEYFDLGNTIKGKNRMSKVEQIFFWPSIYEAYVYAPKSTHRGRGAKGCRKSSTNWKSYVARPARKKQPTETY